MDGTKAVFTLGARALVPRHRHKMVLCSETEYPGSQCLVQCPSTRSSPCSNTGVGSCEEGVFTLVPIKNRSQTPCSGTKSERSLRRVENTRPGAEIDYSSNPRFLPTLQCFT